MTNSKDLAWVVLEVLDEKANVVHRHRCERQVPKDEKERMQFTGFVDEETRRLRENYPWQARYVIQVGESHQYIPYRETSSKIR